MHDYVYILYRLRTEKAVKPTESGIILGVCLGVFGGYLGLSWEAFGGYAEAS